MQTDWAQQQEQQEQNARIGRENVEAFTRMWLSLGGDVITAAGSSHRAEIDEALGLAAHRWSRLRDLEAQVVRDEQDLAARPKKRPREIGDDMLADEVIKRLEVAFAQEADHRRAGHEELKELAKRERKELESFITKRR